MKEYIKNRKTSKIESAMRNAVSTYQSIEKFHDNLDRLDRLLDTESFNLESALDTFSLYGDSTYIELYAPSWRDTDNLKTMVADIIMACTELFGEGKRSAYGDTMIQYEWKDEIIGTIRVQVGAEATGCRIIEVEEYVPPQPATTKKVRKIECGGTQS